MTATTTFEYGVSKLRDLHVPEAETVAPFTVARASADKLLLHGEPVKASKRFWHSLQVRFGFTPNIFRYFSHAEVFRRITETAPDDAIRWCLERGGDHPRLLAVSNPKAAVVTHDDLSALLDRHGAEETTYHDGVVRSTHAPRHGAPFQIGGDAFESRYVIDTPVDGFGRPSIYLSLLRQICTNGAVALTPAFRSEINLGRGAAGATFALVRALEGFNNEEGFLALRQRFEGATRSWASVYEATRLYKTLTTMLNAKELPNRVKAKGGDGAGLMDGSPVLRSFHTLTGDLSGVYGLANMDALSAKRQRTLPAPCRVYDLLNFASELATHHANPVGGRRLQGYIGELVSSEYDLENTADQFADWRDFFVAGSTRKPAGKRR